MNKEINLFQDEAQETAEESSTLETKTSSPLPPRQISKPLQEMHLRRQLKRIIEALLFSSNTPMAFDKLRQVAETFHPIRPRDVKELLLELQHEYLSQQRAFRLEEIAQGYILRTCEEFSPYIEALGNSHRGEKLSQASAEVLAIIAYKQPITRPQIEAIRGVDSSGTIYNLMERQLIEPVGKSEAPGRPTLYGITIAFLEHFGLKDLKQLPPLQN